MIEPADRSRRRFVGLLLSAPLGLAAGTSLPWAEALAAQAVPGDSAARDLAPTPECGDDDDPTPSETQGPFYTPDTPLRRSLIEPGTAGTRIVVAGAVFTRDCRPVPNALLDFWHADGEGEYDNVGFKLRGHQFTDAAGRYRLETIVPGLYPGRTRHIHVRVQAPHGRILTTQMYFPGEARNRRDFLYRPELLMEVKEAEGAKQGRFHFKLGTA
jgi:protocatechuate 3,4-dioxygenase beta subunit